MIRCDGPELWDLRDRAVGEGNDLFQRRVGVKVLEGIAAGEHTERSLILDVALAPSGDRRRDTAARPRTA